MSPGNLYEWIIGLRYLRAKRSQHFIGVITVLSMCGIALGVAALIVVLAVMTGFRAELQKQILGVTSHVVIQSYSGRLSSHQELLPVVSEVEGVAAAAPYILGQAMLAANGKALGVVVRGVEPQLERHVSALAGNLVNGSLDDLSDFGVILGRRLADSLQLRIGDKAMMMSPSGNVTAAGTTPRLKRFRVAGVFDSGMYEYDSNLAYIHLSDAQTFFRYGAEVTGIEIRTHDPELATGVRHKLDERFEHGLWIRDWMEMNRNFFRALQIEKVTMFIILFLVVVVAAFNIVSSLIMVVMEKNRDIAILKTMGATALGIMAIFVINGGVIGITGTLLGLGLGLALAHNLDLVVAVVERTFEIKVMAGDVYYIDHLPSVVNPGDVVAVVVISLLISLVATIYPAWRGARVDPVEALRYE